MQGKQNISIFCYSCSLPFEHILFLFDAKTVLLISVIIISTRKLLVDVFVILLIHYSFVLENTLFAYLTGDFK